MSLPLEQFLIPSGTDNGSCNTTGPGMFPWAAEVTPPYFDGERADQQEDNLSNGDPPVDAEQGGASKRWNTTVSVPPSKTVRDGVCFRGLCVLLFAMEEEQQQTEVRMRTPEKEVVRPVGIPGMAGVRKTRAQSCASLQGCQHRTPRAYRNLPSL